MQKTKGAKGTKVTLKMAKKAIRTTIKGWRRLTLTNMGITVFPKCLLKLGNIDELDLSRNQIQKLPNDIGNCLSLKLIDLHSNKLESVPETIGNLKNLTYLNLSNNCLKDLPSTLGTLTNLKVFNVGMNHLDSLPPSIVNLENLEELGLFDNQFTTLEEFVTDLPNLTKINLRRNPLWYAEQEESMMATNPERDKNVYLVYEKSLCKTCLKKCKEKRQRPLRGTKEDDSETEIEEDKCPRRYMGLLAPNSVAKVTQNSWRIRNISK